MKAQKQKAVTPNAKTQGRTLADFRSEHDKSFIVPQRIRDALKKLGNGWEYEVGFMRLASLSTTDLAAYRDEFSDHIVMVGGRNTKRVWVGTKELAAQMRQMIA